MVISRNFVFHFILLLYFFTMSMCWFLYQKKQRHVFLCLYCVPFDPVTTLGGYKTEETEAQRAKMTCPTSPSCDRNAPVIQASIPDPEVSTAVCTLQSWITPLAVALATAPTPSPVQSHDAALPGKLCKMSVVTPQGRRERVGDQLIREEKPKQEGSGMISIE